jgi:hypothetical protein
VCKRKGGASTQGELIGYDEITLVTTFTETPKIQIHLETLGTWMTLDAYISKRCISGKYIIMRNDFQSGLFRLENGSKSDPIYSDANSQD